MDGYDPRIVASFVQSWRASNAVGGKLIRAARGYKGEIQVFDAQGAVILTRNYDTPRSYWDLLGDIEADVMTKLDVKPSPSLTRYLHKPRCSNFQSVVDLGSAALMEEKSPEEFAVYQKIISTDPNFSMVRHWYANQKHWNDGDDGAWETQNGLALSARIEPASIEEFTASFCPDPVLKAEFPDWLDKAQRIAGTDLPKVLCCRLRNECFGSQTREQIMERALKVCQRYPNSHCLMVQLAMNIPDRFMAASLLAASLFDHYQTASGIKVDEQYDLAWMCNQIGRQDLTMEMISVLGARQPKFHLDLLLEAMCRGGQYAQARDLYPLLDLHPENMLARDETAPYAVFAAYMGKDFDFFERVLHDQNDGLATQHLTDVFHYYDLTFTGKNKVMLPVVTNYVDYPGMWKLILTASIDAAQGKSDYHYLTTEAMFQWPLDRLLWFTEDDYQRRDPSPDAPAFYNYLQMFFSYDPWVKKAVADYHKRGGGGKPIDAAALQADLQSVLKSGPYPEDLTRVAWKDALTPWRVATCVQQLLQQHKAHDAADIARSYEAFMEKTKNTQQISMAGQIMRMAEPPTN